MIAGEVSFTFSASDMRDTNVHYALTPGVIAQHVGDGTVVYSIREQSYFALNATGATVWAALEGDGAELETIVAATRAAYPDAPESELLTDVGDLLEELVRLGLVRRGTSVAA